MLAVSDSQRRPLVVALSAAALTESESEAMASCVKKRSRDGSDFWVSCRSRRTFSTWSRRIPTQKWWRVDAFVITWLAGLEASLDGSLILRSAGSWEREVARRVVQPYGWLNVIITPREGMEVLHFSQTELRRWREGGLQESRSSDFWRQNVTSLMLFRVVFGEDSSWTVDGAIASTRHFTPLFIASSPPMWITPLLQLVVPNSLILTIRMLCSSMEFSLQESHRLLTCFVIYF